MSTSEDKPVPTDGDSSTSIPPGGILVRRYAGLLAFLAVLFIVQTGLVPYDFTPSGAASSATAATAPTRTPSSFPDLVSNIFLYVPLGALVHWALCRRLHSAVAAWLLTMAVALFLSAGIEWAQAYSPARVSSLADVIANLCGAAIGASLSWLASRAVPRLVDGALHATRDWPRTAILKVYCVALLVFATMPFSFSFDTSRIKKAVKATNVVPFRAYTVDQALADDVLAKGDHFAASHLKWKCMKRWSRWAAELISFAILAWLLYPVVRDEYRFSPRVIPFLALWIGCGLAVILSVLQFIVVSRECDVTDVLFRWLGFGTGLLFALARGAGKRTAAAQSGPPPLRGLARAGWVLTGIFIIFNGVLPISFDAGPSGPTESMASAAFLPFFGYQESRFDKMADDVTEKLAAYALFAACLSWYLTPVSLTSSRTRLLPALLAGLIMAGGIEVMQMFMTVRYASLTDLILAAGGCVIGVGACQQVVVLHRYATTQTLLPSELRVSPTGRRLAPADALVASLTDPHADAPAEPSPTRKPAPRS